MATWSKYEVVCIINQAGAVALRRLQSHGADKPCGYNTIALIELHSRPCYSKEQGMGRT